MANGGLTFLLLLFLYLVGRGLINLVISVNLFRSVHVANMQRRRPIPHKRGRDPVPIIKSERT
jgi:hypothetical protein